MAIDFSLSPELEEIRGRVRTFIADVVTPTEARLVADRVAETDQQKEGQAQAQHRQHPASIAMVTGAAGAAA